MLHHSWVHKGIANIHCMIETCIIDVLLIDIYLLSMVGVLFIIDVSQAYLCINLINGTFFFEVVDVFDLALSEEAFIKNSKSNHFSKIYKQFDSRSFRNTI